MFIVMNILFYIFGIHGYNELKWCHLITIKRPTLFLLSPFFRSTQETPTIYMVENGKIKKIHIVEPARKVKRNQRGNWWIHLLSLWPIRKENREAKINGWIHRIICKQHYKSIAHLKLYSCLLQRKLPLFL